MQFNATAQVINFIINKYGFKSYLEIGVQRGNTFNNVNCRFKIGVDPDPNAKATFIGTSDDFFALNNIEHGGRCECGLLYGPYSRPNIYFDIIFIDGLHHYKQVMMDLKHSLICLNDGGIILIHDTNPPDEAVTVVPRNGLRGKWCGDVYKIFGWVPSNVNYKTIDYDGNGLTICKIAKQFNGEYGKDEIDYAYFNTNRGFLSRRATHQQFIEWI